MELSEALSSELLDAAPDAMLVVHESGTIVLVNAQTESMFGFAHEELVGQPIAALLPGFYQAADPQLRNGYVKNPRVRSMRPGFELCGVRKNASEFAVEISVSQIATAAGTMVSIAVRDISERKAKETNLIATRREAERANRAKSEFLAAASQNLRQPLQTLELLSGVLNRGANTAKAVQALAAQRAALNAMSDLLNTLLDISKLESGVVIPDINNCSVQTIFRRLRANFEAQAAAKGIRLLVDDCTDTVRTDAGLLEQLVQNLVANAIRYTREGSVSLRCRRCKSSVRIEVADTGIGIAQEQINVLFDEFYQIKGGAGAPREGHGLGLAIVERLSQLLGHRIEVESTPGKGSCFAITLPCGEPALKQPAEIVAIAPPASSTHNAATVLIIDDDPAVMDATQLLLELEGYRVLVAPTLAAALDTVHTAAALPVMLLADYHLGEGITGINAIHAVRDATRREIPAVLMTGDTSSSLLDILDQVDNCRLVSKPVHVDTLLRLMQQLITVQASDAVATAMV